MFIASELEYNFVIYDTMIQHELELSYLRQLLESNLFSPINGKCVISISTWELC